MNVSLHQLKVFVAVARERSFTRAAREFELTQSAVSRCIRELEDALEIKLFDRTTRHVELTHAGASLECRIGRLLDEIDLTLHEERTGHEGHSGVVMVASNPVLSTSWIPDCLARCAATFPHLTVCMKDQPQAAVLEAVERGEVDFGVVSIAQPVNPESLHAQLLFSTSLCAVMPSTHRLSWSGSLSWTALDDVTLVTLNEDSGTRSPFDSALAKHGLERRPVQRLGHAAAVLRLVEVGLGIGVLPVDAHWPSLPDGLVARPLVPEVRLMTMLIRRKNRSLRPNAAAAWAQFAATVNGCVANDEMNPRHSMPETLDEPALRPS
ncbi:LysR family transcriptional regulator [Paraburkholderia sp.]|uniref:LysR family transcriptional regulator n=1 Tax=Paraburkholderia sp. TaxID=1926495 RepID=UPI0023A4C66D|nr:LysR family transcriptional regulator [Paraburkholderia sp.]MDE1179744.1 LysR family transcriptional regulator [Paraburkholderia sp.]